MEEVYFFFIKVLQNFSSIQHHKSKDRILHIVRVKKKKKKIPQNIFCQTLVNLQFVVVANLSFFIHVYKIILQEIGFIY